LSIGLVRCDHNKPPQNAVCIHLLSLQSTEWIPALDATDGFNDWLCPECYKKAPNIRRDDLRAVCVQCIDEMRWLLCSCDQTPMGRFCGERIRSAVSESPGFHRALAVAGIRDLQIPWETVVDLGAVSDRNDSKRFLR